MAKDNKIVVVDAEYHLDEDRGFSPYVSSYKRKSLAQKFAQVIWGLVLGVFKLIASLMVEGISGTVDGIKQASELEEKKSARQERQELLRRKRPIWYIPTKEEEEADRRGYRHRS